MNKLYVVSIPWDSRSIDKSYVFTNKKKAEAFAKKVNEQGYHGYTGGVKVEKLERIAGSEFYE